MVGGRGTQKYMCVCFTSGLHFHQERSRASRRKRWRRRSGGCDDSSETEAASPVRENTGENGRVHENKDRRKHVSGRE